jgi:putative tryptophan/tyrosine transport system substrate-binding protein
MLGLRRRQFITLLSGAAAAWPVATHAQQAALALVGLLSGSQVDNRSLGAIRQGLKDAGYIEGRNLAIKYHSADARFEQLPALAADLVADPVAAILVSDH